MRWRAKSPLPFLLFRVVVESAMWTRFFFFFFDSNLLCYWGYALRYTVHSVRGLGYCVVRHTVVDKKKEGDSPNCLSDG